MSNLNASPYGPKAWLYDWQLDCMSVFDASMHISLLQSAGVRRVVELGCGTGRVTERLAEAGFEVTGVDYSPYMLIRARERLTGYEGVSLACSSMETFKPAQPVEAVIIPFSSFLCLESHERQVATLVNVSSYLTAGGLCIIDVFEPDLGTMQARTEWRHCFEREHCVYGQVRKEERLRLDEGGQRFVVESRYTVQSEVIEDYLSLALMSGRVLIDLMGRFFTIAGSWRSYEMAPRGPKCIVLGVKEH